MNRKKTGLNLWFCLTRTFSSFTAWAAADESGPAKTLIRNVNVFDGISEELSMNKSVQTVIAGGGRTLLPGFIEGHAHLMLMGPTLPAMEAGTTWEDFA